MSANRKTPPAEKLAVPETDENGGVIATVIPPSVQVIIRSYDQDRKRIEAKCGLGSSVTYFYEVPGPATRPQLAIAARQAANNLIQSERPLWWTAAPVGDYTFLESSG